MAEDWDFIRLPRRPAGYRAVTQRLGDWEDVARPFDEAQAREQASRCMDCGTPFCHACGCPLANVIPETNALARRGRWREALALLQSTNPFPEFTGRICPAPCESACVLGINRDPVTIRDNERTIIERGFTEGWVRPRPPAVRLPGRVAVIGSGPAGLAVADTLNRLGYGVTVYDAAPQAGGMLRYGIPEFKLEKRIVDRRVALMREEGVVFELGVRVGADLSSRYLQSRFAAICLAGGAREPRDLAVPGRDLQGIHFALDYLRQQNRRLDGETIPADETIEARGCDVVIIGGGDTGSDCLGTALRQGARSVQQFEILPEPPAKRPPETPWPLWPASRRDSSSHQEGGSRRWSVAVRAFGGRDGRVTALSGTEVNWERGPEGRLTPRDKPGGAFEMPVDLVLLAMGFTGPRKSRLLEELGARFDARGNVIKDAAHMCAPGVFAAGDLARGASLVVQAMADGLATAAGIHVWLTTGENR